MSQVAGAKLPAGVLEMAERRSDGSKVLFYARGVPAARAPGLHSRWPRWRRRSLMKW